MDIINPFPRDSILRGEGAGFIQRPSARISPGEEDVESVDYMIFASGYDFA